MSATDYLLSQGGFRIYSSGDVSTLRFIRNLQTLGFSLNEIQEFLSLRTNDLRACSEVRKKLDRKLKDIQAKPVALLKLEDELMAARTKCDFQLKRARGKNVRCPVLASVGKSKHKGGA